MTYNVHRCLGTDGRLSCKRIAEVIGGFEPDVVALQELDVGRIRSGGIDQAHEIAHQLGMSFHFNPALRVMEELYGDAILTTRPCRLVRAGPLPGLPGIRELEPRGALWAAVEVGTVTLQVINTQSSGSGAHRPLARSRTRTCARRLRRSQIVDRASDRVRMPACQPLGLAEGAYKVR